jgi:hypothetical protein
MGPVSCLCFGEEINHMSLPGYGIYFLCCATCSIVSIQNALSWLLHLLIMYITLVILRLPSNLIIFQDLSSMIAVHKNIK